MIDILALPTLALLVVVYLVGVWVMWLRDKDERALTIPEDDDEEETFSPNDRWP
jgi:hypothetical protein